MGAAIFKESVTSTRHTYVLLDADIHGYRYNLCGCSSPYTLRRFAVRLIRILRYFNVYATVIHPRIWCMSCFDTRVEVNLHIHADLDYGWIVISSFRSGTENIYSIIH